MKYVLRQEGIKEEHILAKVAFQEGMFLYGFCGGFFGRDSYGTKLITKISGNLIIVKEENGKVYHGTIDGKTYSWASLLEDSNDALQELEEEREREG
jgi:hypothetical protein